MDTLRVWKGSFRVAVWRQADQQASLALADHVLFIQAQVHTHAMAAASRLWQAHGLGGSCSGAGQLCISIWAPQVYKRRRGWGWADCQTQLQPCRLWQLLVPITLSSWF